MSIPIEWLGALAADLEIEPPAPASLYDDHSSLWVRCTWHTGMLWWRREHVEVQEFICRKGEVFWPGVRFEKVSATVWLQLRDLLQEYHAKQEALRLVDL